MEFAEQACRAGVDAFASAAETGQVRPEIADEGQIQSATLEMAGSGLARRGDLRSPAATCGRPGGVFGRCDLRSPARLPDSPRGNARHLGRGPARSGSRAFRERPG